MQTAETIPNTKPVAIPNLRSVCSTLQPTIGSKLTNKNDTRVGVSEYTEFLISVGTKLTNCLKINKNKFKI